MARTMARTSLMRGVARCCVVLLATVNLVAVNAAAQVLSNGAVMTGQTYAGDVVCCCVIMHLVCAFTVSEAGAPRCCPCCTGFTFNQRTRPCVQFHVFSLCHELSPGRTMHRHVPPEHCTSNSQTRPRNVRALRDYVLPPLTCTLLPLMPVLPTTGRTRRRVRHSERPSDSPRVIHGKDTVVTAADASYCIASLHILSAVAYIFTTYTLTQ